LAQTKASFVAARSSHHDIKGIQHILRISLFKNLLKTLQVGKISLNSNTCLFENLKTFPVSHVQLMASLKTFPASRVQFMEQASLHLDKLNFLSCRHASPNA
jgi:hypothetical protein